MNLDTLQAAGFVQTATWRVGLDGSAICDGVVPKLSGLYIFAVGKQIKYVGTATSSLDRRMQSYRRRQKDLTSDRPVHKELAQALVAGGEVDVYVRTISSREQFEWQGLPTNVLVGVEAALIADINPTWNRRGRLVLLDTESLNENLDEP